MKDPNGDNMLEHPQLYYLKKYAIPKLKFESVRNNSKSAEVENYLHVV